MRPAARCSNAPAPCLTDVSNASSDSAMTKTIARGVVALAILLGLGVPTSQPAQARRGDVAVGIAAGTLLGLGIAGAYAGPRSYYGPPPGCYRGPRRCGWAGSRCRVDRFGEQVCSGGEWRCWRPTVCD
jgi:hypothetical protein